MPRRSECFSQENILSLYPLSTDLEELRRLVTELAEFKDDLTTCDENKLEAIRTAWNEEFLERTQ